MPWRRYVSAVFPIEAVTWLASGDAVLIVDQTLLPQRLEYRELRSLEDVCDAISRLAVRGAPAIGVAGAMGLVIVLQSHVGDDRDAFLKRAESAAERIAATRPTAVNLPRALGRVLRRLREAEGTARDALAAIRDEATRIRDEDREMCQRIGEHALTLLPDHARVLTHCNAGALATAGIGTALAPIYLAAQRGRVVEVLVGETRPLLQGSRLTAWELSRAGVPVTVVTDGMAPSLMREGRVDLCIVGADRIAHNGDAANKIGTYGIAVAARYHGIPFYVAAPSSTLDASTDSGREIRIERRPRSEIAGDPGRTTVPEGVPVENPAFDITPAELITAIITERGIHRPPYDFPRG